MSSPAALSRRGAPARHPSYGWVLLAAFVAPACSLTSSTDGLGGDEPGGQGGAAGGGVSGAAGAAGGAGGGAPVSSTTELAFPEGIAVQGQDVLYRLAK